MFNRVRESRKDRTKKKLPFKWKLQLTIFAAGIFFAAKGFEHGMPILGWVSVGAVAIAVLTSVSKHQCAGCGYPTICIGPRETSFCPKCGNKDEAVPEQGVPQ